MTDLGKIVAPDTIRFERLLPGPIERVWDFLTKPEHLASWLGEASFEGRTGGFVELKTEGGIVRGVVNRWEPPRRLVYSWLHVPSAEQGFPDSLLTFELEPKGKEVVLVLTHRRVTSEFRSRMLAGWHVLLDVLRARLEGRQDEASMEAFQRLEREYGQSPR